MRLPTHWVQALRGKSALTQDEALNTLSRARSVLDNPCECTGNPPTYEYRKDKRQHCMWCDGLSSTSSVPLKTGRDVANAHENQGGPHHSSRNQA